MWAHIAEIATPMKATPMVDPRSRADKTSIPCMHFAACSGVREGKVVLDDMVCSRGGCRALLPWFTRRAESFCRVPRVFCVGVLDRLACCHPSCHPLEFVGFFGYIVATSTIERARSSAKGKGDEA